MADGSLHMRAHPLPIEALEKHLAILATSGAGKTVAAKGAVENLMDAGARVCVIDPTGVWHGMRTMADGSPGYPFAIFGAPDPRGERHVDVEIGANSGAALARLIATNNLPAIINTLGMTVAARTKLFTDFAEAVINENNEPLHLIIDECHHFMPQGRVPDPQSGLMVNAANNLVSGGRARGFAIMLISQRAAKVHKDSLTQVQSLVAMQMTHHLDQKVIEDWIKAYVGPKEATRIVSTLPSMPRGAGWFYAPGLPKIERVKFPMIRTLDTSDRPRAGETRPSPMRLADIDLDEIRAALAEAAPAPRRAQPQQRAPRAAPAPRVGEDDIEEIKRAAFDAGLREGVRTGEAQGFERGRSSVIETLRVTLGLPAGDQLPAPPPAYEPPPPPTPPPAPRPAPSPQQQAAASARAEASHQAAGERLGKALAMMLTPPSTWEAVCLFAEMAPGNGYFYGGRKWLAAEGLINETGKLVSLTAAGAKRFPREKLPTRSALIDAWAPRMKQAGPKMLRALAAKHATWFTEEQLSAAIQSRPGNGYWYAGLKSLRAANLIDEEGGRFRLARDISDLPA